MTPSDLISIINQASNLTERLSADWIADGRPASLALADQRLTSWGNVVAQGDLAQFEQRLAFDGLCSESVRPRLGQGHFRADSPMPTWADLLQAALMELGPLPDPCFEAEQPVPFEELLSPFVALARQRLAHQPIEEGRLNQKAEREVEYWLLTQLAEVAGQTFYWEFSLFLASRQSSLTSLLGAAGTHHYQAFVSQMRQGGLREIYQQYTVLARLLATLTEHWHDRVAEFRRRLVADWAALEETFGPLGGQVVAIKPGLSDRHHQGRTVMAVTFKSGMTIAYKPRSLDMDGAWYGLLNWCNQQGIALPFKRLRYLNRPDYGWLEWVSHNEACPDQAAVERYYRRSGMLLALIHLLEGLDCHVENVIAYGEQPIFIDPEMFLFPRTDSDQTGSWPIWVMRTSFLPDLNLPQDDSSDGLSEPTGETMQWVWQAINQDHMGLIEQSMPRPSRANLPQLNGVSQPAVDYLPELKMGFQVMYQFLRQHHHSLLSTDGPLAKFKSLTNRFTCRDTRIYDQLLQKLYHPTYLKQGIERSVQLELLSATFLNQVDSRPFWPLLQHERDSLERLDIPHFTGLVDSNSLPLPNQHQALGKSSENRQLNLSKPTSTSSGSVTPNGIEQCFISSSYEQMLARFETLAGDGFEAELTFQLDSIETTFRGPQKFENFAHVTQLKPPSTGSGCGTSTSSGSGISTGSGCGPSTSSGCGTSTSSGCGISTGSGCGTSTGSGCGPSAGSGCGTSTSSGCGISAGSGCGPSTSSGCGTSTGSGSGPSTSSGCGISTGSGCGMLAQAIAIGQELERRAIHLPNGQVSWLLPIYQARYQAYRSEFMGDDLYEGRTGVALFLAALAQVTEVNQPDSAQRWSELADQTTRKLTAAPSELGAGMGLGSQLYTLVRLSQLRTVTRGESANFLEQAKQLAQGLTISRINAGPPSGLLEGLAGAIMGLLAIYHHEAAGDATILERAIICGEQLLHQRVKSQNGSWGWPSPTGKPLIGFSHGSAGIGYALGRLYQASHEERFQAAAMEAMAYARATFSTETHNQPDLQGSESSFDGSWCNGAAGLTLAQLGCLTVSDCPQARSELETTIETRQHLGWTELDTLCCGNFGQIEVLLQAGLLLHRSDWVALAQQQAEQLLNQAKQRGHYRLFDDLPPQTYHPGFFRGLAGIGYTLLRLAQAGLKTESARLPCVLQWE